MDHIAAFNISEVTRTPSGIKKGRKRKMTQFVRYADKSRQTIRVSSWTIIPSYCFFNIFKHSAMRHKVCFKWWIEFPIIEERGMLSGAQLGYIGGILGAVLGFAGGAFGTFCSIRNTRGPKERRFMIKASVVGWIAMLVFLGLLLGLPSPYRFFMWVPYAVALPAGIHYVNSRLRQFQMQDGRNAKG